jgi:hypothetical protein
LFFGLFFRKRRLKFAADASGAHAVVRLFLFVRQPVQYAAMGVKFMGNQVKIVGVAGIISAEDCISYVVGQLDNSGAVLRANISEAWNSMPAGFTGSMMAARLSNSCVRRKASDSKTETPPNTM